MNNGSEVPEYFKEKIKSSIKGGLPNRLMMNWDEVSDIYSNGFYIGAHTSNHKILIFLDEKMQEKEISDSIRIINSKLNTKCESFAYPNGLYNNTTLSLMKKTGIRFGFSAKGGLNTTEQEKLKIKRIGVNVSDSVPLLLLKLFINRFK